MRTYDDCELCGASRCKHGLCSTTGDPWTDDCPNARGEDGYQCQNCAEAAHERMLEDYYGGSTPQTDAERLEVAYKEKYR